MSTDREHSPTSSPPPQRRASLTGSLFSRQNGANMSNAGNNNNSSSFPGPITTAAATANQRRMSITTLGLSGSPTQTSPFSNFPGRRESLSSAASYEDAVDDSESPSANQPTSPFARRVSFGAQALREARGGNGSANGRYSSSGSFSPATRRNTSSTHTVKEDPSESPSAAASTSKNIPTNEKSNLSWRPTGEGFNWSAALRNRAERAPSIGGGFSTSPQSQQPAMSNDPQIRHQRAASIAIMEQPTRELPREPRQNKPDFFQEKILRADFMD